MSKAFYLVHTKNGFEKYLTWTNCRKAVVGVKGVLGYKGFNTQEQADYWIKQQVDMAMPVDINHDLVLYTDGGSRTFNKKQRKHGSKVSPLDLSAWAYVIIENGKELTHDSGFMRGMTNNYQELNACYHGLQFLKRLKYNNKKIHLVTDSKYLINTLNYDWDNNQNPNKPNLKAGKTLSKLFDEFNDIHVHWVKGHNKDKYNNKCDELCTKQMEINR